MKKVVKIGRNFEPLMEFWCPSRFRILHTISTHSILWRKTISLILWLLLTTTTFMTHTQTHKRTWHLYDRPGPEGVNGWFHPGQRLTVKKLDNCFLRWYQYFTKNKYWQNTTFMYQLRFSRGPHDLFFRTFTCWTCLKHVVNLANKYKWLSFFGQVYQVF